MTAGGSNDAMTAGHAAEHLAKLAMMANQIGDFFKAYPEEQAVAAIADHINQFWTKGMREQFRAGFEQDAAALSPLVRQARDKVRPGR
jgi:formate dehydrogenase subunit delta